jgi:hypothetical protein
MRQRENPELMRTVSALWREHSKAVFPGRLRGQELAGVDLMMLDADIAGCIVTWQGSRSLDERHQALLTQLLKDVESVLPLLIDTQERAYYARLGELARLVSGSTQQ